MVYVFTGEGKGPVQFFDARQTAFSAVFAIVKLTGYGKVWVEDFHV